MSGSATPPVFTLFLTVVNSILKVFFLCLAGYTLACRGILDKKTQKQINHLNACFFIPALLFSKVAFFLSPEKLIELWIVPILSIFVNTVSLLVAYWLSRFAGLKRSQRSFAMAAAMFMNCNSLPVALVQSLVISLPALRRAEDDNEDTMVGRALTYLMLNYTLNTMLRWTIGVQLLSQPNDEAPPHPLPSPHTHLHTIPAPVPSTSGSANHIPTHQHRHARHYLVNVLPSSLTQNLLRLNAFMTPPLWAAIVSIVIACAHPVQHIIETYFLSVKGALAQAGNCSIPLTLMVLGAYFHVPPEERKEERGTTRLEGQEEGSSSGTGPISMNASEDRKEGRWIALRRWLGLTQPIALYLDTESSSSSVSRPTSHLDNESHNHNDTERHRYSQGREHQPGSVKSQTQISKGENMTVCIAILSRMVITPVLLMPLLVLATKLGWHPIFKDPVFMLYSVIIISSPTAFTLAQITQAVSGDAFERLISRTIFWSNCVLAPPTTVGFVMFGVVMASS